MAATSSSFERSASLPMYPLVPFQHTEIFWSSVYKNAPSDLALTSELQIDQSCHELWTNSNLGLSQSCGYPVVKKYKKYLQLVGTPVYNVPGCEGTNYRSAVIVNSTLLNTEKLCSINNLQELLANSSRPLVIAANSFDSFSGWLMLLSKLSESLSSLSKSFNSKLFSKIILTGSHAASMMAVETGLADIAAIDCVTYHLAQVYSIPKDEASGSNDRTTRWSNIRVLDWTLPAPALPFITSIESSPSYVHSLRSALELTLNEKSAEVSEAKEAMFLENIDLSGSVTLESYEACVDSHLQLATSVLPCMEALLSSNPPPCILPDTEGIQVEPSPLQKRSI